MTLVIQQQTGHIPAIHFVSYSVDDSRTSERQMRREASVRPWQFIVEEASHENDRQKLTAFPEELYRALEERDKRRRKEPTLKKEK